MREKTAKNALRILKKILSQKILLVMIKNNLNYNNSIIIISSMKQAKKLKINNNNFPILCMSANIFFFF